MSLFYSVTHDGRTFTPRMRVPTDGTPRHPQLAIDAQGSLLAVWDEAANGRRQVVVSHATAVATASPRFTREVIRGAGSDQYPVVAATDEGGVVAWVSGAPEKSVIRVRSAGESGRPLFSEWPSRNRGSTK